MRAESVTQATFDNWVELRRSLWPDDERNVHQSEANAFLAGSGTAAFVVRDAGDRVVGFAEAALRHDYVNGCLTSPVAFLEGIYVAPQCRRRGAARALVASIVRWAKQHGCSELASDADLSNDASHIMHLALGLLETERVVYFRMDLAAVSS